MAGLQGQITSQGQLDCVHCSLQRQKTLHSYHFLQEKERVRRHRFDHLSMHCEDVWLSMENLTMRLHSRYTAWQTVKYDTKYFYIYDIPNRGIVSYFIVHYRTMRGFWHWYYNCPHQCVMSHVDYFYTFVYIHRIFCCRALLLQVCLGTNISRVCVSAFGYTPQGLHTKWLFFFSMYKDGKSMHVCLTLPSRTIFHSTIHDT